MDFGPEALEWPGIASELHQDVADLCEALRITVVATCLCGIMLQALEDILKGGNARPGAVGRQRYGLSACRPQDFVAEHDRPLLQKFRAVDLDLPITRPDLNDE